MKRLLLLIEGILMILFTILDLTQISKLFPISNAAKYMGILYCVLFVAICLLHPQIRRRYSMEPSSRTDASLTLAALCFTAMADWFLVILNRHNLVGVGLFIPVQLLYLARLLLAQKSVYGTKSMIKALLLSVLIRLILIAVVWTFLYRFGLWEMLNLEVFFYFTNLVSNMVQSFLLYASFRSRIESDREIPRRRIFLLSFGLLLFTGCDVSVGLWNIPGVVNSLSGAGYLLLTLAMWTFYLPSQVLITLSAFPPERNDGRNTIPTGRKRL